MLFGWGAWSWNHVHDGERPRACHSLPVARSRIARAERFLRTRASSCTGTGTRTGRIQGQALTEGHWGEAGYSNAAIPVIVWPRTSVWMSCVPS
jgi:hypothetical protein